MNRRNNGISRGWRKFGQFVCLAGFVLSLVCGVYAILTYTNFTGESSRSQPAAIANNSAEDSSSTDPLVGRNDSAELGSSDRSITGSKQSSNCGSSSGGPTDNAIAAYYENNPYSWTNQIQ